MLQIHLQVACHIENEGIFKTVCASRNTFETRGLLKMHFEMFLSGNNWCSLWSKFDITDLDKNNRELNKNWSQDRNNGKAKKSAVKKRKSTTNSIKLTQYTSFTITRAGCAGSFFCFHW